VIDAHAHLTDRRFATDVAEVLDRARKAGIERVLTAGEDVASSEEALRLAAHHDDIRVARDVERVQGERTRGRLRREGAEVAFPEEERTDFAEGVDRYFVV